MVNGETTDIDTSIHDTTYWMALFVRSPQKAKRNRRMYFPGSLFEFGARTLLQATTSRKRHHVSRYTLSLQSSEQATSEQVKCKQMKCKQMKNKTQRGQPFEHWGIELIVPGKQHTYAKCIRN